jgi:hypothetical protein
MLWKLPVRKECSGYRIKLNWKGSVSNRMRRYTR